MNDNERFRQTFVRETDAMIEHYKLKVSTSAEDAQQELLKTKTYVLSRASEFIEECTYKTLAKPKMAPQLQKYMRTQFHSRFADKVITPYNEEMQHLFIDLPESVERCAQDLGQKWKATGLIPLPRMKEIKHKVWAEEVNILRKKMLQLIELGDAIGLATSSLIFGMVGYKIGEEYAEFKGKESAASVMQSGMDVIQTGLELTSSLILEGSAFTAGGGVVGAGGGIAVTAGAAPVMLAEAGLIAAAGVDGAAKGSLAGPIGASIGIAAGGTIGVLRIRQKLKNSRISHYKAQSNNVATEYCTKFKNLISQSSKNLQVIIGRQIINLRREILEAYDVSD